MRIARVAFFSMLLMISTGARESRKASIDDGLGRSTENKAGLPNGDAMSTQGQGPPFFLFPQKEKYATQEDDTFIVAMNVQCPAGGSLDEARLEVLPPTPNFVRVSSFCSCGLRAIGLLTVAPQRGDAGTYDVKVRATGCGGSLGGLVTFKLKVKRAG